MLKDVPHVTMSHVMSHVAWCKTPTASGLANRGMVGEYQEILGLPIE